MVSSITKAIFEAIERVEPERNYNITEMRREALLPWLSSTNQQVYTNTVMDDRLGDNVLKAKIRGTGRGREYRIKGKNIIKFLNLRKPR